VGNWTAALSALTALATLVFQWWLSRRPAVAARKAQDENIRIHNEVAAHDVAALRARLSRLRAGAP
jgi:hypothetical protein